MNTPKRTLQLAVLLHLSAGVAQAAPKYTQVDVYDSSNFFDKVDFFSGQDPTNGFVKYVTDAAANRHGLAGFAEGGIYLGGDYVNTTTTGRSSVRVSSKQAYTKGLFMADIAHMPAGTGEGGSCGLWPAYWMFGPNWPTAGEIDIIEGVNSQTSNSITLHTGPGCSMSNTGSVATTNLTNPDCQGNQGCGQTTFSTNNFGAGFNAIGGGIYAVEWTSDAISVWFFPRTDPIVAKLSGTGISTNSTGTGTAPDPLTFGQPLAKFVGGSTCDIDSHFANHNIVFNIDYCGDWAGKVWSQDKTCSKLAKTCEEYVSKNPNAFVEAYWLVNSVKVYQQQGGAATKRERSSRLWRGI